MELGKVRPSGSTRRLSHLLLVDDDPALLEALSGTLRTRLGHFTVDTCTTGMAALDCLKVKHYDTVISDVNMPGMSGLDLVTAMQHLWPKTPVFLISGDMDQALLTTALEAGASDCLAKPFDRDVFVAVIRRGLASSALRALLERQHLALDRAKARYAMIMKELNHDHDGGAITSECTASPASHRTGWDSRPALAQAERPGQASTKRTIERLRRLDRVLVNLAQTHRQTSDRLDQAQETMRRHAVMKH